MSSIKSKQYQTTLLNKRLSQAKNILSSTKQPNKNQLQNHTYIQVTISISLAHHYKYQFKRHFKNKFNNQDDNTNTSNSRYIKLLVKRNAKLIVIINYLRKNGIQIKNNSKTHKDPTQSLQLFYQGKILGDLNQLISELDPEKKGSVKLTCTPLQTF